MNKKTNVKRMKKSPGIDEKTVHTSDQKTTSHTLPQPSEYNQTMNELQQKFWKTISTGPEYVCCCCEQLWYRQNVVHFCASNTNPTTNIKTHCTPLKEGKQWICETCLRYIQLGKIPQLGLDNNMTLTDVPTALRLHPLEERLVALRTPFMQIRELPRGRQLTVKGNVVNVPADVTTTVKTLPRTLDDGQTIPVKFKRKLVYKSSVHSENVRPNKIIEAAEWLVQNSQLYKDEGVIINHAWNPTIQETDTNWQEFVDNEQPTTNENAQNTLSKDTDDLQSDSDDDWTETITEQDHPSIGTQDTMLTPEFHIENQLAYCLAPSEGNTPIGVFQDSQSEILAFPTLFCGQPRKKPTTNIHYSTICKWELRHRDRRFAKCIPNLFYKIKKIQIQKIKQKVTLCLRKKKIHGKKLTAQDFKCPHRIKEMLCL